MTNAREATSGGRSTTPDGPKAMRLVSYSPDRTLFAAAGELFKVYERGSMADAKAEAILGSELYVPGVVRYLRAEQDERTNRPCVVMDYHPGISVDQWIAEHGPFPPRIAARVAAELAATLMRFQELAPAHAPNGFVHRDVKPGNVFLVGETVDPAEAEVLLLDLEHAAAAGAAKEALDATGLTGATHGFSPPEAYNGSAPEPSFDVFGFGATLHVMLTGRPPFIGAEGKDIATAVVQGRRAPWTMLGHPEPLADLVSRCLATDQEDRPTMGEVRDGLLRYAETEDANDQALDAVLGSIQRQELRRASSLLKDVSPDASPKRRAELVELLRARARLVERTGGIAPAEYPSAPFALAQSLVETTPRVVAWLGRFPASRTALQMRTLSLRGLDELLETVPSAAADLKRDGQFKRAEQLLATTLDAAQAVDALPKGPPRPTTDDDDWVPGPMQREPKRYLELALRDLHEAARAHGVLIDQLERAEAALDLNETQSVLQSAATMYSGASSVVAGLKDRVHRLSFYIDRIAQPAPSLEELGEQLELAQLGHDLGPVLSLHKTCIERAAEHGSDGRGPRRNSIRALQRILHDLLAEFPHAEEAAAEAIETLDRSTEVLTDFCWDLLADARGKLTAEPIPVRPLQSIVHRIDTLRRLEVLVDRPEHSRADLLDEHERLRTHVDQARAARDRLARGAEEAMERGHYTTALYDMERAVDRFTEDPGEADDNQRLVEQLEKARKQKEAIDRAAAENMQLAARYADLQDDPQSTHASRVALLLKRKKTLCFLADNMQEERAEPYQADLDSLELTLAQERSDHADARLDAIDDPEEREQLAQNTLAAVRRAAEERQSVGRRLQRILDRWERRLDSIRQERRRVGEERRAARAEQTRRRRFLVASGLGIAAILGVSGAYVLGLIGGEDSLDRLSQQLSGEVRENFELDITAAGLHFKSAAAFAAVNQFAQQLRQERDIVGEGLVDSASHLADAVSGVLTRGPGFAIGPWSDGFRGAVLDYDRELAAMQSSREAHRELIGHLERFRERALVAGVCTAIVGAGTDDDKQALAGLLEEPALRLPPAVRDAIQRLK